MAVRAIDGNDFMRRLTLDTSKGHYGEFMDGSEVTFTSKEIAAFVEQMPTFTSPNKWISVEEQIPNFGKLVIATDGTTCKVAWLCSDCTWMVKMGYKSQSWFGRKITHWMPLPAPPNKGDAKMNKQDAIKCLKSIQRWVPDFDNREDGLSYWDAIDMAIDALSPPNEPLTLDELRKMNNEPIWVQNLEEPDKSQWRIIHWDRGKYLVLQGISVRGYLVDEYGESWLAYRHPPEGDISNGIS